MNQDYIDGLIISYINNEIDEEQSSELEKWLQENPENRSYMDQLEEIWRSSEANNLRQRFDPEQAFRQFRESHINHFEIRPLWKNLAAAAAIAMLTIISFKFGQTNLKKTFETIVVEAPVGSESVMTLPDGTKAHLNAASSLRYSQGFGIKDRNVELEGECYFEVTKNEALPFNVKSEYLNVQVLGTKFNFRDYRDEVESSVSLLEGRVALKNLVHPEDETKYLNINQQAILNKISGKMHIDAKDATKAISWKSGILFFDEVMLCDIAKELERTYDVSITIQDSKLSQMRVYGNFLSREQRIEDILNLLSATNNIRYKVDGRNISIF